jgi:ketosteroid isomerase-like protein
MEVKRIILSMGIAMIVSLPIPVQGQSSSIESTIPPSDPSPMVKEEEAREFFAAYVDKYTRRDIEGFLSLFSPKAVQNQKETMGEMRKIYSAFFNQSHELKFQMEEIKVEIYQNGAEVKARYEITQTLRRGGEKRGWRGTGSWFLAREEGALKILYLNYQHQKVL